MKMRMLNVGGKITKVPKLNETKAIEQGSEILSEMIILTIASSILIFEYNRSSQKEEAKEAALAADRETVKHKIFELEFKVEKQTTQIRELARTLIHLEEDIHKRSLTRMFEKKPKVSDELVESAKETSNEVFLLPLDGNSSSTECQTVHIKDLQLPPDATIEQPKMAVGGNNGLGVESASIVTTPDSVNSGLVIQEASQTVTPTMTSEPATVQKGVILSAVNDLFKK